METRGPLIMGIVGIQTWELHVKMTETPYNGHSRCVGLGTQKWWEPLKASEKNITLRRQPVNYIL